MSARRGFTLLELLVVLIIVAMLAFVLLSRVHQVQHVAVLAKCSNNLRVLGIASHHFRDTHGHFPPGTMPNAELPPERRLSWHVSLLPYIELQKAYDLFDPAAGWDAPRNAGAERMVPAHHFTCPGHTGYPQFLHTSYPGVAGVGPDAAGRPSGAPGAGFFGYDRKLTRDDVKDGLTNTLMVLETAFEVGHLVRGGPTTVRAIDPRDAPLVGPDRPFGGLHRDYTLLGGTRPLGVRALMADGGVRLSAPSVDAAVLAALATIAGGEEVPADW